MDHVTEKRKSVRTPTLVPCKVSESSGRERLVKVLDLSLEGCRIVCSSNSPILNLRAPVTLTFFEEVLILKTDETTGRISNSIEMHGCTPIAGEVIRTFSRSADSKAKVYGIKFSHTIDYQHPVRQIIADSSH